MNKNILTSKMAQALQALKKNHWYIIIIEIITRTENFDISFFFSKNEYRKQEGLAIEAKKCHARAH